MARHRITAMQNPAILWNFTLKTWQYNCIFHTYSTQDVFLNWAVAKFEMKQITWPKIARFKKLIQYH